MNYDVLSYSFEILSRRISDSITIEITESIVNCIGILALFVLMQSVVFIAFVAIFDQGNFIQRTLHSFINVISSSFLFWGMLYLNEEIVGIIKFNEQTLLVKWFYIAVLFFVFFLLCRYLISRLVEILYLNAQVRENDLLFSIWAPPLKLANNSKHTDTNIKLNEQPVIKNYVPVGEPLYLIEMYSGTKKCGWILSNKSYGNDWFHCVSISFIPEDCLNDTETHINTKYIQSIRKVGFKKRPTKVELFERSHKIVGPKRITRLVNEEISSIEILNNYSVSNVCQFRVYKVDEPKMVLLDIDLVDSTKAGEYPVIVQYSTDDDLFTLKKVITIEINEM